MARVIVEVMPKPEILDPQGRAILGAIERLGVAGVTSVRQGKRFEIEVDGELDADLAERLEEIAGSLLSNPVIEDFEIFEEVGDGCGPDCSCGEGKGCCAECSCDEGQECGPSCSCCAEGQKCGPDCECGDAAHDPKSATESESKCDCGCGDENNTLTIESRA